MRKYIKQILFILLITPFLTELISGNVPITSFINPLLFVFLATFGYGFPVLAIREYAIRKNLGVLGVYILGLAYGLYNEGWIARTIFQPFHSPFAQLADFGLLGSVRIPWAIIICSWHALFAVLFPIVLSHFIWQKESTEKWLSDKAFKIITYLVFIFGVLSFFIKNKDGLMGPFDGFIFMILVTWTLFYFAKKASKNPTLFNFTITEKKRAKNFGIAIIFLTFILPILFIGNPNTLWVTATLPFIGILYLYRRVKKYEEINVKSMAIAGMSMYITFCIFTMLLGLVLGNPTLSFVDFISIFILWFYYRKIKKAPLSQSLRPETI